jgi:hypothetical protein
LIEFYRQKISHFKCLYVRRNLEKF